MNNNYENINFDVFDTEPDRLLSEKQKSEYINNFYRSIGMKQDAVKRRCKRCRRKSVAIAAAMVMVLAFGAVTYAGGLLDLGKIKDMYNSEIEYEYPALEDSNQYKAAKEYSDYFSNLSRKEQKKLTENEYGTEGEKPGTIVNTGPNKVLEKVLKKYNLKYSRISYDCLEAVQAINAVGLSGFGDKFLAKYDNGSGGGGNYTDVGYMYLRGQLGPDFWEIAGYPDDVYIDMEAFNYPHAESVAGLDKEWFYATGDGHKVKCATRKIVGAYTDKNGNDIPATLRGYEALVITDNFTIDFYYSKALINGEDLTKEQFEEILELFDFSKLD